MGDQCFPDIGTTMNALNNVFRNASLMEELGQEFADCRSLLAGLEDDDIARDQCWHDVAVRQVSREIIRPQNCHHAMRFMAQGRRALKRTIHSFLAGTFGKSRNRNLYLVLYGFDFGPRFPQGLAGFARDQFGEWIGMLQHFIGEPPDQFHAPCGRFSSPAGLGRNCPVHRTVDIANLAAPDLVAGCRFGRNHHV